jgi:hypothetical protein
MLRILPFMLLSITLLMAWQTAEVAEKREAAEHTADAAPRPLSAGLPKLVYHHDVSPILGADDDYTETLSKFDYESKFKSGRKLTAEERAAAYKKALDTYSDRDIQRLDKAFQTVFGKMNGLKAKLPAKIHIFSEQKIEGGAAYTRANVICMPKRIVAMVPDRALADLAAHEMFHVISRYNRELRPAMYATIGYRKVGKPVIPENLSRLTIANPDAPENDYAITGTYRGKTMDFMPILHSKREYRPDEGSSFFAYLNDDLLAVEIKYGVPTAVLSDGEPLIVEKEEVGNFFEQVGRNTDYTYHPEETVADHFKFLLLHDIAGLPDPDKVRALEKILRP